MFKRPFASPTPLWVSRSPRRMLWSPVTCALIFAVSSWIRMESWPIPICWDANRRSGRKSEAKTPTDVSEPTVSTSYTANVGSPAVGPRGRKLNVSKMSRQIGIEDPGRWLEGIARCRAVQERDGVEPNDRRERRSCRRSPPRAARAWCQATDSRRWSYPRPLRSGRRSSCRRPGCFWLGQSAGQARPSGRVSEQAAATAYTAAATASEKSRCRYTGENLSGRASRYTRGARKRSPVSTSYAHSPATRGTGPGRSRCPCHNCPRAAVSISGG